ncbi:MAG: RsmD family RNA methyltransferase [Candidatus Woesearchaeota archaeon]|nr:MAG: RsmD family RNA methyltransferase [Candidatus Woesearchaeota archaeon]
MGNYIFILGRDPELSVLELKSYLEARNIEYEILEKNKHLVVLEMQKLDFNKMIKELGGIVKIAETGFKSFYDGEKNKVLYGESNYGSSLEIDFRQEFKKEGINAYLNAKGIITPSKSLRLDAEFILFKDYLGKIIAVFNPKEYKERDKRPFLDPLRVSSIRLSKILINLSQAREGDLLLDPFCGLGTVLQEALLMNVKVIGLDKDAKTVKQCEANLNWLGKKGFEVFKADAVELSKHVKEVDCVATEPYLGPFLKRLPTDGEAKKIVKELEKLYFDLFKEFDKVVKKRVAIILPRFRTRNNERYKVDVNSIIEGTDFEVVDDFPIDYYGEESRIEREIWVLKRKV